MEPNKVVSQEAWLAARRELLRDEKEFTRLRDRLSQKRRDLPWVRVDKPYVFQGPNGQETLPQLFDGRSQLIVYHFMYGPDSDTPCKSCSFWADNFERNVVHLKHRDVTLIAVSREPLDRLEAFKRRMGWTFKWVSSAGSDFNFDYQASFRPEDLAKGEAYYNYATRKTSLSELPGISVFCKDASDTVFHTYSCYARGLDMMNVAYQYLDLVPKGRDESGPHAMAWVRYRDSYGDREMKP
jgi:predicted dithiol-disulfide oxidoreductase (DUF899 family)